MATLSYEQTVNVVSNEYIILRRERPSLLSCNAEAAVWSSFQNVLSLFLAQFCIYLFNNKRNKDNYNFIYSSTDWNMKQHTVVYGRK